jgi:hypothetical protein
MKGLGQTQGGGRFFTLAFTSRLFLQDPSLKAFECAAAAVENEYSQPGPISSRDTG